MQTNLRSKLVGSLGIRRGRHKHGMAGPLLIDLIERRVILGDHEHLLLVLLPRDADEPIAEKGQVGLADSTDDHRPLLLPNKSRSLGKGVVPPFGSLRRS